MGGARIGARLTNPSFAAAQVDVVEDIDPAAQLHLHVRLFPDTSNASDAAASVPAASATMRSSSMSSLRIGGLDIPTG
ncbi:hypothetical protein GCM10022225_26910 [Plantactinospora mayteni]|uniref:Uncharacterized protein n=1 Tax=Plantactinospora mayteni TaxID=566021 RepID=A0ABQ4EIX7_9ACTN|nr:hypothetical protein Pma05_11520 [Plantactinospora mayteni]